MEFHGVEHAQHRTNLNEMQKVHRKKFEDAEWVKEAVAHNLQLRKTANANGLPLFHLWCTAKKLQKDMEKGLHNAMKPKQFLEDSTWSSTCASRCNVFSSKTAWRTKGWRKRKNFRNETIFKNYIAMFRANALRHRQNQWQWNCSEREEHLKRHCRKAQQSDATN